MAIDAKVSFLGQVEHKLADAITVSDMAKIMESLSDILECFQMREIVKWDENAPDDLLDSYIASLRVQGKSELTINRYVYKIKKFMDWVGVPTRRVNVYHIRSWIAKEKERGIADSTLEGDRSVLSAYFGWLFRESLIEHNPVVNVGTIKVPKKEKELYSPIDIAKLDDKCSSIRDKAIMHFLASTGCRISEMTGLNRDAIDFKEREVIVHGKGNKERVVYFDPVTGMLINEYLKSRKDDNEALFIGKRSERLQPGGVRVMMKQLAKEANVNHVHPHKFRRTFATMAAKRGMPVQEICKLLGHEKIDTTMRYVVLDRDTIKASYKRYA